VAGSAFADLGLPIGFIIALLAGGVAAALAGLMVAFPSFRTRGDYLAIVTLAVNFIVTGVINNIEAIGGPRDSTACRCGPTCAGCS